MAAPETQFQPAGLTVPQLTPSVYHPGAVNVPDQAGALWAQVGQNMMTGAKQVFQTLMESPLNPTVKAQMQEGRDRANMGINYMRWLQNQPYGFGVMRESPEGASAIAPAEAGETWGPYLMPQKKNPNAPPAPPPPPTAPGTGKEPVEKQPTKEPPPGPPPPEPPKKPYPEKVMDPDNPPTDIAAQSTPDYSGQLAAFRVPSRGGSTAGLSASTDNAFLLSQRGQPGPPAAPGGAPPGQFLNPATGSYEPLQQGPAPGPAQPPAPLQPPTQAQQPQAQALQPGAQQTQPNWAQGPGAAVVGATPSLHPVMSSQTALEWAQHFDTSAKRAVYLPQGPTGEPAYAIYGARNTPLGPPIPISQMVRHGATGLVGGENLSSTLNVADQQQQAQQQAAQQQAAQQQPPQQPTPPQQPYPTIASDQGGPQGAPAAPGQGPLLTSTAYDQSAYHKAVAEAMANPSYLSASADRSGTVAQPKTEGPQTDLTDEEKETFSHPDQMKVNPDLQGTTNGGDPYMGDLGPFHMYRDDRFKSGELYAIRPGLTSLYKQQRHFMTGGGWQDYDLPDTNMRLNTEALFGGGKGSVSGQMTSEGRFPTFTHDQIANMPVDRMQRWLTLGNKYLSQTGVTNDETHQNLQTKSEASKSVQRLLDMMDLADNLKLPPQSYSGGEEEYQKHLAVAMQQQFSADPRTWVQAFRYAWEQMQAGGRTYNPFMYGPDGMAEETRRMYSQLVQVKGIQDILPETKQESSVPVNVSGGGSALGGVLSGYGNINTRIPLSSAEQSVYRAISRLYESGDRNDIRQGLQRLKARLDQSWRDTYDNAAAHNYRFDATDIDNRNRLDHKQPMYDGNDIYRDNTGRISNPFRNWPAKAPTEQEQLSAAQRNPPIGGVAIFRSPATGTPQTSARALPADLSSLPHISAFTTEARKNIPKNSWYMGPDNHPYYKEND